MGNALLVLVCIGICTSLILIASFLFIIDQKTKETINISPLKIGEVSVSAQNFSSVITSIQNNTVQLDNRLVISLNTNGLIVGKSYVDGTIEITKSICSKDMVIFTYVNGTKLQGSVADIVSKNQYDFSYKENPYCVNGTEGIKLLNYQVYK